MRSDPQSVAPDLVLSTPTSFPSFPYDPPYDIQVALMQHVYHTIESKEQKVAIVESPTGTGKTLSLLCSTLTWLDDDAGRVRRGKLQVLKSSLKDDNDPEWVHEQALASHIRILEGEEAELQDRLARARHNEEVLRRKSKANVVRKKQKVDTRNLDENDEDDLEFLPDDELKDEDDGISPAVRALMKSLSDSQTKDNTQQVDEPTCTKIYYASRTHSQLAQLRGEVCLQWPSPPTLTYYQYFFELLKTKHNPRIVPLASRRNLCINDELRAKGDSAAELDEGCREMINDKKGTRCPYLPPPDEDHRMLNFRDHILATPKDIEDLVTLGKELGTCPYFGSRRAIPQAQLVTLPYNLLLQRSAREALGIDITNHVVVVDEAHNLIDSLLSVHTVSLSLSTLTTSIFQLTTYLTRFRKKLSPTHGLHLRRLLRFLGAMKAFLESWRDEKVTDASKAVAKAESGGEKAKLKLERKPKDEIMPSNKLMESLGSQVDGVNLLEIEAYLRRSKIARKISGYSDKEAEKVSGQVRAVKARRHSTPPLHAVEAFILALTNNDSDGRISLHAEKDLLSIKYQLLNPSNHFREIVEAVRCVILAGGTMSPMNELGQVLTNIVNLVPYGLVVFFPSYSFLNSVKITFQKSGLLERLNGKKKIFFEPESTAEVENVLRQYALAISSANSSSTTTTKKGGALLFAVVGAKLSEGINFSDSLARGVVIVGLPFPSLASVELKERMRYVTELEKTSNVGKSPGSKDAGMELYENQCMKSVNQSIGRAIRHQKDYASLILVDARYGASRINAKLPKWIGKDIIVTKNFGQAVKEVGQFFRQKNN
ncbi:helicase C-terminal domain-containing protein [Hysterangium stoloniferum]|nr:helicase C-terminal domain-containing protein [Hysterangium stoloniferum]